MATITTVVRNRRGCGMQKPGGLYLRSDGLGRPCGKLPIPLEVCPHCGHGIKQSRTYSWIDSDFITAAPCGWLTDASVKRCHCYCAVNSPEILGEKVLLIWIGEQFYPSPYEFIAEDERIGCENVPMGVSRRVKSIPRGFKVGESCVALAHPKAIVGFDEHGSTKFTPGIFQVWRPTFVEYIVTGEETEEELNALEAKGFRLIKVIEFGTQIPMFDGK